MTVWLILSYCYFVLAAICNAVMDNVQHHPSQSVLKDIWGGWWVRDWRVKYKDCDGDGLGDPDCGRIMWKIAGITFKAPVQLLDGWHFSKMCMVFFLALSVATATLSLLSLVWGILYLVIIGVSWNITFNIFYNRLLRRIPNKT